MIHIITRSNRHRYSSALTEHFRIRHDIYVRERKWMEIARPDGLERDQFDNDSATYVLAIDDDRVIGGSRLIPTTKPHLLSEVFPHLASVRGLPCGPDVYEWTRMFVVKDRRDSRGPKIGPLGISWSSTAAVVACGVLEHCLSIGVTTLIALVEMWWLPRFHDLGWKLIPLGLPEPISDEWSVAVKLAVDQRTLDATREYHGFTNPVVALRPGDDHTIAA